MPPRPPRAVTCAAEAAEAAQSTQAAGLSRARHEVCAFYEPAYGILRVDDQRWRAAQSHEATLWTEAPRGQTTDRNAHHAAHFGNYAALPESLGHVVELGCGPYTQLQTILRPSSRVVSITLVDPLAVHYQAHAKGCTYKVCRMARRACAWVKRRGAHPHLLSLVWRV